MSFFTKLGAKVSSDSQHPRKTDRQTHSVFIHFSMGSAPTRRSAGQNDLPLTCDAADELALFSV